MKAGVQQDWVLLSASADHENLNLNSTINDPKLVSFRKQNSTNPELLHQDLPRKTLFPVIKQLAILLIGELRCFKRSSKFFSKLADQVDIFVVTTSRYEDVAYSNFSRDKVTIVDHIPAEKENEAMLPVASMKQWHKISLGLKKISLQERSQQWKYENILKVRSDFFFAHPKNIIRDTVKSCRKDNSSFVGASDKIFASSRNNMMLLISFYSSLIRCYYNCEEDYWPINLRQILHSDDAIKWYGMNWPVELVGKPQSTDIWRKDLETRFHELSKALHEFRPGPSTTYHRLFQGHPKFASEVCFARFLNSKGIPFRDCYSLRGFLYKDRDISQ